MLFRDQLNREINLPDTPGRIISLVPSQTELLYELGLENSIIGQTIFCIHPSRFFKTSTKIGGTKKVDLEKIRSLKPDLIIANKEENDKIQIEHLSREFPVWISDINTIDDSLSMIKSIGEITNTVTMSSQIIGSIREKLTSYSLMNFSPQKVIYLIWNDPYIAVGRNTFINSMLSEVGFENLITSERYPEISIESIKELNPDLVFLSSEPFPFKDKHAMVINQFLEKEKSVIVDGEMFSWYGSRMLKSFDYFKELQYQLR